MAHKELVKDYIERIKFQNNEKGRLVEFRPCFFYCPKLDEMLLMQKQIHPYSKVSNIYIYTMLKKDAINNIKLSKMSPIERQEFFKTHMDDFYIYSDDHIARMSSYIQTHDDFNFLLPEKVNRLSVLDVDSIYRKKGIAKELITELKSETINNNLHKITARMSPLDSYNVTLDDLAIIYKHLGFDVSYTYYKEKDIKMNLNTLPKTPYPTSFTNYDFKGDTQVLIR